MLYLSFALGIAVGLLIAYWVGQKRAQEREHRQWALRDAISEWAYYYQKELDSYTPNRATTHGHLLAAIYDVGTSNIHRHDRW